MEDEAGATLREARKSGPGGPSAQYVRTWPKGARRVLHTCRFPLPEFNFYELYRFFKWGIFSDELSLKLNVFGGLSGPSVPKWAEPLSCSTIVLQKYFIKI